MNTKQLEVLDLLRQTWVRIKPSDAHGVGVFTIRDIPANTNIFIGVHLV